MRRDIFVLDFFSFRHKNVYVELYVYGLLAGVISVIISPYKKRSLSAQRRRDLHLYQELATPSRRLRN